MRYSPVSGDESRFWFWDDRGYCMPLRKWIGEERARRVSLRRPADEDNSKPDNGDYESAAQESRYVSGEDQEQAVRKGVLWCHRWPNEFRAPYA